MGKCHIDNWACCSSAQRKDMSWIHKFVSYWHNDGHMGARRQSMKPGEEVVEISLGISKWKGVLVNRGSKEGKGKTTRVQSRERQG